MRLSAEQIRNFHVDGFLRVDQPIADETELERLRGLYDELFLRRAGRESGDQFDLAGSDEEGKEASLPQILNPAKYAPEIAEGAYVDVANRIVKDLLGEEASVGVAHAIYKPAGAGAATPWHQDEAYWDPSKLYCAVSVWMPLQEATVENGCLWFVPGSHRWPILPHQSIGGDVRVHGLEVADQSRIQGQVACPLPPGGITIHLNRTAHYAGPNQSGVPRRALILMGGLPEKAYPEARSFPWNEAKQTAREARSIAAKN